jgi:hypothetical protein
MSNMLLLTACLVGPGWEDDRPDLVGTIWNQSGEPVAGATVFIYTAAPRTGTSVL